MRATHLFPLLLAAACGASRPADPGDAPTPFTAEQIRDGCPDGRRSTFLLEVAGRPPVVQVFSFSDGDKEGCMLLVAAFSADDKPMGEAKASRSTWEQFRSHASFPAEQTRISDADVVTPAGRFDCMLYTVRRPGGSVEQYYFAKSLPGPPVRMTREEDDKTAMTLTLMKQETPS